MYYVLIALAGYVVVYLSMLIYLSTKLRRTGTYMLSMGFPMEEVDAFYSSMNFPTMRVCHRNGWLFGIPLGVIISIIVL